jgi:hypothetical protein
MVIRGTSDSAPDRIHFAAAPGTARDAGLKDGKPPGLAVRRRGIAQIILMMIAAEYAA